jgi:hypothetical protein
MARALEAEVWEARESVVRALAARELAAVLAVRALAVLVSGLACLVAVCLSILVAKFSLAISSLGVNIPNKTIIPLHELICL